MKQVGKRKTDFVRAGDIEGMRGFLDLMARTAKEPLRVPRGVYRFRTFEEAEEWRLRMLAGERPPAQGGQPSKT